MLTRDYLLDRMEHFLRTRLSGECYTRNERFRPSLTISREFGAGMDAIGHALVEHLSDVDDSTELGWALFDHQMIGKIIEDNNLPKSSASFIRENAKFPVVEAFAHMLNLPPSQWTLFNYSADTIRHLCQIGNAIIVGRAANFVTSDLANTFHVRIIGSPEKRIERTADLHEIETDDAAVLASEADESRKRFVSHHTNAKVEDPVGYHLILNTDDFATATVARIIGDSLLEWAHQKETQSPEPLHENVA